MNFHTRNYGTKPMERVFNPEHFDMRLETKHLMVPELLVPKVYAFSNNKMGPSHWNH